MKDYVAEKGGAALGARLRRLTAAIDADASRVYAAHAIRFEQRWFGVINQLVLLGPQSVRQLADALGITHASVSETRQSLEKAGLITSRADPNDARRRLLALSPSGRALTAELKPLWAAFDDAAQELDAEAGGVVESLARLEHVLARRSLYDRITALHPPATAQTKRSAS